MRPRIRHSCTEVLLQHWKSVCSNVAHVPLESEDTEVKAKGLCPAMWSDPAVCEVLIDAGADIETRENYWGYFPLLFACRSGSLDVVKLLVRAGAEVRVTNYEGDTGLSLAVYHGHTDVVRYLAGLKEVELDHANNHGQTALRVAVEHKRADLVEVLIDAGAEIEARDSKGRSPLSVAAYLGQLVIVKQLVRAGAELGTVDAEGRTCLHIAASCRNTDMVRYLVGLPEMGVNHVDTNGCTALHAAAQRGYADVVQVLVDAQADIETRDNKGHSPLLSACASHSDSGQLVIVKQLIRAGADVSTVSRQRRTCLHLAASYGLPDIVRYLVGLPEVDVNHVDTNGRTALHDASVDVVQVLVDVGADIEVRDNEGRSPLLSSTSDSYSGKLAIVKQLVEAGAGVRTLDTEGRTCLHLAVYYGHSDVVRYLAGLKEVELDHANNHGQTALRVAVEYKRADLVEVLIDAGADIETTDNKGRSPLVAACASYSGQLVIVQQLFRAGAELRTVDAEGQTCLHLAASYGLRDIVRYLVRLPVVDVNHVDTNGCTALHAASQRGYADVVQALVEYGADTSLRNDNGDTALRGAQNSGCPD